VLHCAFLSTFTSLSTRHHSLPRLLNPLFAASIQIKMRMLTKCASILMVLGAFGAPGANSPPEIAGLDFDIKNFATDAVWKQYVAKGEHLACAMTATDAGAGFLIQDSRTPPSAASPWTGDLRRRQKAPSVSRIC
jgi:hypothetical protein